MQPGEEDEIHWGQLERDRLRFAVAKAKRRGLTQPLLAEQVGISRATLQRIVAGGNPGRARLQLIVDALDIPITQILRPPVVDEPSEANTVEVPIADIRVAAGPGEFALDEATIGTWPFPRAWINRHGPAAQLRVVYVSGDSQEPVLRDGDAVLIDMTPTIGTDGMHVVRLDDALMIKRIQNEGARLRLRSHNPQYEDIMVDLRADQDRFAIVGRAIAAVKSL